MRNSDAFFKPYEIQVQAKNDVGYGPLSSTIIVYTGERCKTLFCIIKILYLTNISPRPQWNKFSLEYSDFSFITSDSDYQRFSDPDVVSYWKLFLLWKSFIFSFSRLLAEAVARSCSVKKVVLEISQNSQENKCTRVPFLIPLLKKRLWHRCSPVYFVKFLRTSFLQNTSGGCFCNCSYEVYMVVSVLIIEVLLGYTIKFIRIYLTNTPRIFHVETTWKRAFPYRFKVGYTWCICKINSIVKPYIAKKTALL